MIKSLMIPFLILGLTFPANLLASETKTLPEFSYSFAEKGTTLTLKNDVYILLPDAWALINTEYEMIQRKWQLKYDTDMEIMEINTQLQIDLRDKQIDYLALELERTNDLLIETQGSRSTFLTTAGVFFIGAISTTLLVFALTKGDGIQ